MNDEKRFFLAFALSILVMLVFYSPVMQKPKTKSPANKTAEALVAQPVVESHKTTPEIGPAEYYEFSSPTYSVKFSNQGASISELIVKEWDGKKIGKTELVRPAAFRGAFSVNIPSLSKPIFNAPYEKRTFSAESRRAEFYLQHADELDITKSYEFLEDKSAFRIHLKLENKSRTAKQVPLEIVSRLYFGKPEGHDRDQLETFVEPPLGKIKVVKEGKFIKAPFVYHGEILWQAITKKYFSIIVKPETTAIQSETQISPDQETIESFMLFAPQEIQPGASYETDFLVYAGPEFYEDLKSFDYGFEQVLTQGVWGTFRYYLFRLLRWTSGWAMNYGFAILIVTLLLKLLFTPFTHMSFESMRKMQAIQPKMKSLQEQYKNDPARMNREVMELYRRHKVNPLGGCLPMILQIPVFIAFYQVLAQMVELKGEALWWVRDLTEPDRLARLPFSIPFLGSDINILPLLMIGSMVWQQKVTPQTMPDPQQAKIMQWMPVFFGFFFYHLPSGLVLYWTLNNLLTVLHQTFVHRNNSNQALVE